MSRSDPSRHAQSLNESDFHQPSAKNLSQPPQISQDIPPPPPVTIDSPNASSVSSTGKVLSQLSPGEKMGIKNKIYDLKKKLELIEIEKKTIEDFPFHPELYTGHYHLPHRDGKNILNHFEKSEYIRKVKMESLKQLSLIHICAADE